MKLTLGLICLLSLNTFGANIVREGHFVFDQDKQILQHLKKQKSLVIDHISDKGFEVYGPRGLSKWLKQIDAKFRTLEEFKSEKRQKRSFAGRGKWPTHKGIEKKLKKLAKQNPEIFKLISIGKSVEGRDLWVMKVSDNVQKDEHEPEFKYVANMHGNEIVGRDMMMLFLADLADKYGKDQEITKLINNTEIYVMPTLNPDGSMKKRRGNAKWVDINRDFPDFTTRDNINNPGGRSVEAKAMMKFQSERHFSLSANFHGGDVVVNYPWDTTSKDHQFVDLIKEMSLSYSVENGPMYNSRSFENGIVNGYKWYEVDGGMQDWSYFYHDDLQVTVELSHNKWPNYREVPAFYNDNRKSLIQYMKNVHRGLGFYFKDSKSGDVTITTDTGKSIGEYSFTEGEFYKVLPEGNYNLKISSNGEVKEISATVSSSNLENSMQEL